MALVSLRHGDCGPQCGISVTHKHAALQVLDLSPEYQKRLLPALQVPMLCQLLMSLTNGGQPLSVWLDNPRVMKLIRETLKALRTGRMHEQQLQDMLCGLLTVSLYFFGSSNVNVQCNCECVHAA